MEKKSKCGTKKRKSSFREQKKKKMNKMFCWNIAGIRKKAENEWEEINRNDIIGLVETWEINEERIKCRLNENRLCIMNGSGKEDEEGDYMYLGARGHTVIDYVIVNAKEY